MPRPDELLRVARVALRAWRVRGTEKPYQFGHGPADRIALAEVAACLVRYNLSPDGRITPRSAAQGFASLSFGQKKCPSGFATARILAVLHRLDDLAVDAATVDVTALGSSKGGAGTALPPAAFR